MVAEKAISLPKLLSLFRVISPSTLRSVSTEPSGFFTVSENVKVISVSTAFPELPGAGMKLTVGGSVSIKKFQLV